MDPPGGASGCTRLAGWLCQEPGSTRHECGRSGQPGDITAPVTQERTRAEVGDQWELLPALPMTPEPPWAGLFNASVSPLKNGLRRLSYYVSRL